MTASRSGFQSSFHAIIWLTTLICREAMFAGKNQRPFRPSIPQGRRVYAIGDIHGEINLLRDLLVQVSVDNQKRGPAQTTLVFLGDFIDRGDGAAQLLHMFAELRDPNVVVLKGNHEAALVEVYRGDKEALTFWLGFGGKATMAGLGIDQTVLASASTASIFPRLQASLERSVVDWLADLPHSWTLGDYFFVHAGIRPGIKLSKQDQDDLLWIRKPFLVSRRRHEKVIVHGHTIEPTLPRLGGNRIGIDTGAHEHGCLTALGLEDDTQWLIQSTDGRASGLQERRPVSDKAPL